MGQNALSQSDCRIFKSTFLPEEIDETALFFANSQKLQHDQKIFIGHGQKRVWPILSWNLKLTVSEEWTDRINWFLGIFFLNRHSQKQVLVFWPHDS